MHQKRLSDCLSLQLRAIWKVSPYNGFRLVVPFAYLLVLSMYQVAWAQQNSTNPKSVDVNHIISEFTSGETEYLKEFYRYGYSLEFYIQHISRGKAVNEYFRLSQMVLNKKGKIEEKVVKFVPPHPPYIVVTAEDLENLSGPYQFPLQAANVDQYNFVYAGEERLANLDLYIFDITPKSLSSKRRLFHGRVWVGVDSLRIVKTVGKFEQKGDQEFPTVETYRDTVNQRFLFPAGAYADEELKFDDGQRLHLRISIRYMDYVKLN